jgi:hypothetical protein
MKAQSVGGGWSGIVTGYPLVIYKVPCLSVRPWRSSGLSQTDDWARPDKTGSRSCPAALLRGEDPVFAGPGPETPGVRCVRARACRGLETQVLRAEYRGPETRDPEAQCPLIEILKLRSWEPNAATRQQQKKGAASVCLSPETQLWRLLIGLAWLLKLGFLGRYQYIKKRVLSFKFLGFLGMGLGWRVEWGFGLCFFHLHLTMVWVYMGVLRPSKWREKKSQARADCVRPSRVPTSSLIKGRRKKIIFLVKIKKNQGTCG